MPKQKLTVRFCSTVTKPGRYLDSEVPGLQLLVQTRNDRLSKSYVWRGTVHGRRVDMGLGPAKWTSLAEARDKAFAHYRAARAGKDPLEGKRAAKNIPTFREAAAQVIDLNKPNWRNEKTAAQWDASLEDYAYPRLGSMRVDTIKTADVLACLTPIWNEKQETARRVRQRIGAIMKWVIAEGHRPDNPAGDSITAALPRNGVKRTHHPALPYDRIGDALVAVREHKAFPTVRLALEFLVLTAARSGEVRGSTWEEINLAAREWRIPAERMKTGTEHRVPLSDAALAVLERARELADTSGLVFPSARGKVLQDALLSRLVRNCGIAGVPHGFRSSFRQWAAERTEAPRELAEAALAHTVGSAVEQAYQRSSLFEKRVPLMQAWGEFVCNGQQSSLT